MSITTTRRFRRSALLGTAVLVSGLTLIPSALIPSALASDTAHQALVAGQAPAAMAKFHTVETLESDLRRLAELHPQIAQLHVIGRSSVGNHPIWALQLGERRDKPLKKTLILGGHHAGEWISVEVPYLLAEHLVTHASTDPEVQQWLRQGEIWVVPLVNPDGHEYLEPTGRPLWRKNRRQLPDGNIGVDLNRNYGHMWGTHNDESTNCDPKSHKYRGPQPFSEPETQAVRKLMDEQRFAGLLTYHNPGQVILFPWGYANFPGEDHPDYRVMEGLAMKMRDAINREIDRREYGERYKYTAEQSWDFIPTAGDTTDWAYGTYNIPAFTIELRPKRASRLSPLPTSHIEPAWEENWPAVQEFIRHIFGNPALRGSTGEMQPVVVVDCNSGTGHQSQSSPPSPDPVLSDP